MLKSRPEDMSEPCLREVKGVEREKMKMEYIGEEIARLFQV
jgi:hypothetical protein